MTRNQTVLSTAPILTLALVSCSTMTSTQIDESLPIPIKGVAYCLPMGKVTIEVLRNPARLAAIEAAKAKPAVPVADGAAPLIPDAAGVVNAAPSAKSPLVAGRAYRIRYKETVYVPDPSKRFTVRYRPNALTDDDINVQLTKDSLLDLVDVTSEDKSVEVAKKLIEIGKNVFRIAAQGGISAFSGDDGKEELIFSASFDPTSPTEVLRVNRLLKKVDGGPYEVGLLDRSSPDFKQAHSTYRPAERAGRDFSGVAFRPALAYGLVVSQSGVPHEIATVLLPNEAEILYMPITRSAFVKKIQKLDFDQGMLTQAIVKKPSEVLGGVEIPLEITRAILALPGEIVADNIAALKRRQDTDTQALATLQGQGTLQRAVLDEQIKNQDKQLEALKKQEEFLAEKKRLEDAAKAKQ